MPSFKRRIWRIPGSWGELIETEPDVTAEGLASRLLECSKWRKEGAFRYQGGQCRVAGWREAAVPSVEAAVPWKDGGVYLITGGAGGSA
ncbi:hypothetical protein LJK87_12795 [Paenibacillus sp. P25]|nr:hypothetical protein LJK87_12795 [Paenibacillus sp. P25]